MNRHLTAYSRSGPTLYEPRYSFQDNLDQDLPDSTRQSHGYDVDEDLRREHDRQSIDSYISVDNEGQLDEPITPRNEYISSYTPRSASPLNTPSYISNSQNYDGHQYTYRGNIDINDAFSDYDNSNTEDNDRPYGIDIINSDDIPMLDHEFNRFNFTLESDPIVNSDGEIKYDRTKHVRHYYRLEFLGVMIYAIMASNNSFLIARMTDNLLARYIVKISLDHISLLGITYALTNVSTYRSINITLGYILINTGVFNYKLKTVLSYIIIGFTASFIGNLIIISIYYSYISEVDYHVLIAVITPAAAQKDIYVYTYLILNGIINVVFLFISTIIISSATSIECKCMVFKKISLSYILNILFLHHGSGVNNSLFTYTFRAAYSLMQWNIDIFRSPRLVPALISLVVWSCIAPFLVRIFNSKFKLYYSRYIEY